MALFKKPAPNHRQGITGLTKPAPAQVAAQQAHFAGKGRKWAILVPALAFVAVGGLAFVALQKLSSPQQTVTVYSAAPPSGMATQLMNALKVPYERDKEIARLAMLNDADGPMVVKPLNDVVALTQPNRVYFGDTTSPLQVENVEQVAAQPAPAASIARNEEIVIATVAPEVAPLPEVSIEAATDCYEEVRALTSDSTIFFGSGSAQIDANALQLLKTLGRKVEACPDVLIHVTGHSDSVGTEQGNMAMSWKRADQVVASLAELGIETSRFDPVGFGARSPLAEGDSGDDDLNRRVEFHALRKHSENP